MRLMLDWWMVIHQMMEELKYALVDCGAQYVLMIGMSEMLPLSVDNWAIMDVSIIISFNLFL